MGQAPPPWSWTNSAHAADRTGRGARSTSSASGPSKGGERRRLGSGSPHSLAVLPSRTVTTRTPDLPARHTAPPGEQAGIDHGGTVRRGQGYSLRVSTIQAIHRQMLARCQPLDGGHGTPTVPAQRKARREYENASARSKRTACLAVPVSRLPTRLLRSSKVSNIVRVIAYFPSCSSSRCSRCFGREVL